MRFSSDRLSATILLLIITVISLSACTIAIVGSSVAGKPMLWKNRDVFNPHQEIRLFTTEPLSFIANVYCGETHRAWSGVNEAGLAIINSDTYNQGFWGGFGQDDGEIMFHALGHFSSIDEFQHFLDSTNITTRPSTHCYGLIDASGSAVLFEVGKDYYIRYDADDAPDGFIIRTNYADCGDDFNLIGQDRRTRAESLLSSFSPITSEHLIFQLARDLFSTDVNPYPLPFEGTYGAYPSGIIPTRFSINRYYTSSACVIVGGPVPTMWQYLGQPAVSIPIPLWIHARSLPDEVYGDDGSSLCNMALDMKSIAYSGVYSVNSYIIADMLSRFASLESFITARVHITIDEGAIETSDHSLLSSMQSEFATLAVEKYQEIRSLYISETDRQLPSKASMSVHPNPFNSSGIIIFDSDRHGFIDVIIYDNLGRIVSRPVSSFPIDFGSNRIPLSIHGVPTGRYIATIYLDGERISQAPFVLLK